MKLKVLHEAMDQILEPQSCATHSSFLVTVSEKVWTCHPVVASYCCDTPEGKNTSSVKHEYPCIRCLTVKDGIAALNMGANREDSKMQSAYDEAEILFKQWNELQVKGDRKKARIKRDQACSKLDKFSLHKR